MHAAPLPTSARYRTLRVISTTTLAPTAFVLRFERGDIQFVSGQCISLGVKGSGTRRDYSLYSGEGDAFLEVLVREVTGGTVSTALRSLQPGDLLEVSEPHGFFALQLKDEPFHKHLFVATGTGVAPFHSFVRTFSPLDYQMVHGIRSDEDAFFRTLLPADRYVACVSGASASGCFHGRVTDWLAAQRLSSQVSYYLCGNSKMIYDSRTLLMERDIPSNKIFTEVYF